MNSRRAHVAAVPARERGMALLTILLLVAVMGVLAAGTLEVMSRSVAMTANMRAATQAHHYAEGAALVAANRLADLARSETTSLVADSPILAQPTVVPTGGGSMTVRLSDASHCFNVNSLVSGFGAGAGSILNPVAVQQFVALAESAGLGRGDAQNMAMALVDFIDSDAVPQAGGGEDGAYDGYRVANRALASTAELTAVRGWTAERSARLQPFLCALPTNEMQRMNVNTMTAEDAPLLAMLAPQGMPLARARQVIASRPPAGWGRRQDFWSTPAMSGVQASAQAQYVIDVKSDLFRADIVIAESERTVTESVLLRAGRERAEILERRWGPGA